MIHVVVMKCLVGLPLLTHIEILWRNRSQSFKNWAVGVRSFVYQLHSPEQNMLRLKENGDRIHTVY
jgi:hypothetical protein